MTPDDKGAVVAWGCVLFSCTTIPELPAVAGGIQRVPVLVWLCLLGLHRESFQYQYLVFLFM